MDITKLYQKQISLTEWFAQAGHKKTAELRAEDNEKRERLKVLHDIIGLPFDEPHQFYASELLAPSDKFARFLSLHGHELCALRLIPTDEDLPKLRMRGHTVRDVLKWFSEQAIDVSKYKADFVPHSEKSLWSTIFVINDTGIYGEIIAGGHHQLTQGFHGTTQPITFVYDFKTWYLSTENDSAQEELRAIVEWLHVMEKAKQTQLVDELHATFSHDYLKGYFETVSSDEFGLWFIDYNRILGDLYEGFRVPLENISAEIRGQVGSGGIAKGRVRVIDAQEVEKAQIAPGEILVCAMTSPDFLPLMRAAAAIVTDYGGILCHAAITARELRIPCIVGTANATSRLQTGDLVEVDATRGIVTRL